MTNLRGLSAMLAHDQAQRITAEHRCPMCGHRVAAFTAWGMCRRCTRHYHAMMAAQQRAQREEANARYAIG